MCFFKNKHNGHKLLDIHEEEELKKEKISIEDSSKDINENKNKIEELKTKIENEIVEIDKLYEKVDKETTKSYELKHEKLLKEENELKDKLKNEVTKIKENLELNLSKINNILRNCERILKGIKIIKEEENTMIKKLNYISNINKNQKEMKLLFQQLMKNIKISFDEKNSNILYEEYYFHGLPIPKNIEISDIKSDSFKISWNIDDIKIKNIDNKEIKCKIEIKKEKDNEFISVYEGKDNNYIINNLNMYTNYEIRLCSIFNNIKSEWTEKYKAKTTIFSTILESSGRKEEYIKKILEWSGGKRLELLYRGTRDGMTANNFHNKCDNKGKTICLFLNDKNNIFGGYSSIPWASNGGDKTAKDCFIFTLSNIYNTEPTKFIYVKNRSVCHHSNYGPLFGAGSDIGFQNDFTQNNNCWTYFPNTYQDTLNKGKSIFTGDNNNEYFKLKEMEVFELF